MSSLACRLLRSFIGFDDGGLRRRSIVVTAGGGIKENSFRNLVFRQKSSWFALQGEKIGGSYPLSVLLREGTFPRTYYQSFISRRILPPRDRYANLNDIIVKRHFMLIKNFMSFNVPL